jgi:anti-sigma B factor antagonist
MQIEIKEGCATCHIDGEININSSAKIKKALLKLIAKKIIQITVELSKVTYIDSSGIAMLVELLKEAKLSGGNLQLANLPARIKNIFEIKRLDRLFTIL